MLKRLDAKTNLNRRYILYMRINFEFLELAKICILLIITCLKRVRIIRTYNVRKFFNYT